MMERDYPFFEARCKIGKVFKCQSTGWAVQLSIHPNVLIQFDSKENKGGGGGYALVHHSNLVVGALFCASPVCGNCDGPQYTFFPKMVTFSSNVKHMVVINLPFQI